MKFSIVTVCRNAVSTIEATMKSVAAQQHATVEHIVIDGASNDGTVGIVDRYRESIAYFVSEPDRGIYDAMNKGIRRATGEFIIFMNAGDVFTDARVLSRATDLLRQTDAEVAYGDVVFIRRYPGSSLLPWLRPVFAPLAGLLAPRADFEFLPAGEPRFIGRRVRYDRVDRAFFYVRCIIQQAIFYRRSVFERCGPFNADLRIAADLEWLLNAFFKQRATCARLDLLVARYPFGGASTHPEWSRQERAAIAAAHYRRWERVLFGNLVFRALMLAPPIRRAFCRRLGWNPPGLRALAPLPKAAPETASASER